MAKSKQKFSNILGKLVITTRKRDDMEIGCIGICVAVAPFVAVDEIYNVIVKHIDFVKYGKRREILHSVFGASGSYIWVDGEKDNRGKDWFYVYNINDITLLTNN